MNRVFFIGFLLASFLMSCGNSDHENGSDVIALEQDAEKNIRTYTNEYGQVILNKINDTLWQTTFENNDGFVFDTTMVLSSNDSSFFRGLNPEEQFFLNYHWGGLSVGDNSLFVWEFSSYGQLASETHISELYSRPFFRQDQPITIQGQLQFGKGGSTLNDIYLKPDPSVSAGYYILSGQIQKEKYPLSFYSTDESPQGMFSDTSVAHYRLICNEANLKLPKNELYEGTTINDSEGNPCIVWKFADSEAYRLENHEPWVGDEIGMSIKVEGYLTQDKEGSVLRNWKIVE